MGSFLGYLNRAVAAQMRAALMVAVLGYAGAGVALAKGAAVPGTGQLPLPEQGGGPAAGRTGTVPGGASGAGTPPDVAPDARGAQPGGAQPGGAQQKGAQVRDLRDLQSSDPAVWRRAQEDLQRRWSQSGSASMDLLLARATAAIKAGDYGQAVGHLTALLDQAPDFAQAHYLRAQAYAKLGLFGPAVADLGRTLTLNPDQYEAMAGMGAILVAVDRPRLALEAFRRSAAIHPHQPSVRRAIRRLEKMAAGQAL